MKSLFSRTVLLLIVFYAIERISYYSFRYSLPILLNEDFSLPYGDMRVIAKYLSYIPLFSYLLIGFTLDRYKLLRNLKLYFIPIIASLLILLINSPYTFIFGYSIILFVGTFVKINIILKIYDYLKSLNLRDDRVYILMILIINVFGFLFPFINAFLTYNTNLGWRQSFFIFNISIWLIFGLIFFLFSFKDNDIAQNVGEKSVPFKLLIVSLIALISFRCFSKIIGSNFYIESEDYKPELIRSIIQILSLFIFGIIFLFLPKFKSDLKIKVSAYIILFTGLISLCLLIIDLSFVRDIVLYIVSALGSIFDILFYPALFIIFLDTFNVRYRAAFLSAFYFVEHLIPDISRFLLRLNQDIMISIFFILIVGFIIVKYLTNNQEVHNCR